MKIFQMTLKLGCALVMAFAIVFALHANPSAQGKAGNKLAAASATLPEISVEVEAEIGRKSMGCRKFGICKVKIGVGGTIGDRVVRSKLSTNGDGTITVTLLGKAPDEEQTLFLDEDVIVPSAAAEKLGFKSVTLLKGQYAFNASRARLNAKLVK